jgi:hypothetical protein
LCGVWQVYDAAVADITMTANRSQLVDFTLPFMPSAIAMVVPIRDQRSKRAWVFLKPLRYDLWALARQLRLPPLHRLRRLGRRAPR